MMQFDENGYLVPYGAIPSNLNEIVQEFCVSEQRVALYENFVGFIAELQKLLGTDFEVWVDGSFTSKKVIPKDIDLLVFVDYELYMKLESVLLPFTEFSYHKRHKIDCYFVRIYPEQHKDYFRYEHDRKWWLSDFSQVRNKITNKLSPKGFLQLNF
jgi:hypothetical protein